MFFKNMKLKTKVLVVFSAILLFLITVIVTCVIELNQIMNSSNDVYRKNVMPLETLEKVKSEYAELRRLATVLALNKLSNRDAETAYENQKQQYEVLKKAIQGHLDRLVEVKESQERYNNADTLFAQITNEYLPVVERMSESVMAGDVEGIFKAFEEGSGMSSKINSAITEISRANMVNAAQNTKYIADMSQKSSIVILIIGTVSAIISTILATCIGNSLTMRVSKLRKASADIAAGNLDIGISFENNDELGELAGDLNNVVKSLNEVVSGLAYLIESFKTGNITNRINTQDFNGVYKSISEDINDVFALNINETLAFLDCIGKFANGNFNADIPKMSGEKKIMNETVDKIRSKFCSITSDIGKLVEAASSGELSNRVDTSSYEGDWTGIMVSLNKLMETVSTPIAETERVLAYVSNGNFEHRIEGEFHGEFLLIKKSVNNMISNMDSYIGEISDVLSSMAKNNLDIKITRAYVGKFSIMKDAINNIVENFNRVISEISSASLQVSAGAKQITESSISLAEGATEQATSVADLNMTIHNINENTSRNAENAKEAKNLSCRSQGNASKGDNDMKNMLASMDEIRASSTKISKIIKVIDEIAFQTNLLALNATVEAAHAGAHGKGFAVVADEVRSLAVKSQNAAKGTAELIEESINRVNEGTKMADMTAQTLQTIVSEVAKVASIVSDISEASEKQADAIAHVTQGLLQITEVAQNNSATSEEYAAASQELSSQSETLQNLIGVFNLKNAQK